MKFILAFLPTVIGMSLGFVITSSYVDQAHATDNNIVEGATCRQLFVPTRGKLIGDFKLRPRVKSSDSLSHGDAVAAKKRAQDAERDGIRRLPAKDVRRLALQAATKFRGYFDALNSTLHERASLFELIRIALIAEEHLLLMGSPGNAKSLASDLALGNIKDDRGESSYFRIQMTPETTMSETHGPMDYKKLEKTGEYDRLHKQGMGAYRNIFVDEIADARPNATRNILGFLAERTYPQGSHTIEGAIETVIAATNRYVSEWYTKAGDDGPRGVIDRFALVVFMQANFEYTDSYVKLIRGTAKAKLPELRFSEIEALRALNDQVEISEPAAKILSLISARMKAETEGLEAASLKDYDEKIRNGEKPNPPYRATKLHSARTLGKAAKILRAFVVDDWVLKKGKRKLEATIEDLAQLQKFFALNGPHEEFANVEMAMTSNEHERVQLRTVIQEREIYVRIFNEIVAELEGASDQYRLAEFAALKAAAKTNEEKQVAAQKIITALTEVVQEKKPNLRQTDLDGAEIAKDYAQNYLEGLLKGLVNHGEFDHLRNSVYTEISRIQKEAAEKPERERKVAEARAAELRRDEARRLAVIAAEARAADARAKLLSAAFTDRNRFEKIVVKIQNDSDDQDPKDFVVAQDSSGQQSVLYFNGTDSLMTVDSSGASGVSVLHANPITHRNAIHPEIGKLRIADMYFHSPQGVTLLPSNGTGTVAFGLDRSLGTEVKPFSVKPGFLSFDRKNRRQIFLDPSSLKITFIRDGVQDQKMLTFVPNGHWTDEEVRAIVPGQSAKFRISADGNYGVLINRNVDKLFHVDFKKNEIHPISRDRIGDRSDSDYGSILRTGRDYNAESVDGYNANVLQALDVSGSEPKIRNLKASVANTNSVDFGVVEHIAGTSLFLIVDNTSSSQLKLYDGSTGQLLANDVFDLAAEDDQITVLKATPNGFVVRRESGNIVILNMKP